MKTKISQIVISFILGASSCFVSFGQTITEQDYAKLSRLFAEDVRLMGDTRESYAIYKSMRLRTPFSHSRVLTLKDFSINASVDKVLVIVNSSIYSQLSDKINRYSYDIHYVYGGEVIMETVTGGDHTDIKNLILTNQTNLNGVVLIGDIPAAWFEISNDHDEYGYASWPCDLYYMDVNGTWSDINNNGIYDSHSGYVQPEIFVGRISTANMGTLLSEKAGLERYLDKNHKFWIGHTDVNKKFGLSYTDKDWVNDYNNFKTSIRELYGTTKYDSVSFGNPLFGKTDYLSRLRNDRYEFIQLACHASWQFLGMTGGGIYSNEIFNNGTEAIGYNLFCCGACNWTDAAPNSSQGFLAGSHIYNAKNSSLVVVGSTKTGSMLVFSSFYVPLGQGKTIGESLKLWWTTAIYSSFPQTATNFYISWYYGMSIIGDPMVNFYHCMNNRCVSQVTLNSFDNLNSTSYRYIITKDKITANNYVIPQNKHVMLYSNEVILNAGFECPLGATLEISNEGCKSNCP